MLEMPDGGGRSPIEIRGAAAVTIVPTSNASMKRTIAFLPSSWWMRLIPQADVVDYIERFYKAIRRDSTIGYVSPVEVEKKVGLA